MRRATRARALPEGSFWTPACPRPQGPPPQAVQVVQWEVEVARHCPPRPRTHRRHGGGPSPGRWPAHLQQQGAAAD